MLVASMVAPAFAVDAKASIGLEENRIGSPPEDFDFGITGQGQPGEWSVVRDVTAVHGVAIEKAKTDPTENRVPFPVFQAVFSQKSRGERPFETDQGRNADRRYGLSFCKLG